MKTIIVAGNFGEISKASSIINQMTGPKEFTLINGENDCINGGTIEELKAIDLSNRDLIVWVPNISNEEEKHYPKKPVGSVLVVSKVLREGVTETDAISRIFKMGANAVITINKADYIFQFKLIDALGNDWGTTTSPEKLMYLIYKLYNCYGTTRRFGSTQIDIQPIEIQPVKKTVDLLTFINLNHQVADAAEAMGGRYFGNCSTRCDKLFPSKRMDNGLILVSPRNIDKKSISIDDMIIVHDETENSKIKYYGEKKPSVDTPVQTIIYNNFSRINYMIHGHYYVYGAPFTNTFYPCGDIREYDGIAAVIAKTYLRYSMGAINLINHGFILYSSTIDEMKELANKSIFIKRDIGNEKVNLDSPWNK